MKKILVGDAIDKLKEIPDQSVNCIVTSPPYYGLRDYGTGEWIGGDPNCPHRRVSKQSEHTITGHSQDELKGNVGDAIYKTVCPLCGAIRVDRQIGLEETPEEYIERLVNIFRECKRVLRDDGTLWINIGDSYAGSGKGPSQSLNRDYSNMDKIWKGGNIPQGTKSKDLIGIPWMLALIMYECFHCGHRSVIWQCDYMFEDFGYEGEGIVQICHCTNCGAEIEYRIPITNDEDEECQK